MENVSAPFQDARRAGADSVVTRRRRRAAFPIAVLAATAGAALLLADAQAGATARTVAWRHGATLPAAAEHAIATDAFRAGRYAEAYARFAALADAGDAGAASVALMMVASGRPMFGSDWSATPGQLSRWSALAQKHAEDGSTTWAAHDRGE
jgi:hypothetical protein